MHLFSITRLFDHMPYSGASLASPVVLMSVFLIACQPTVKVEAPDEPITINLNVKLDADVRVKLEEQAQKDIDKNEDIF